MDIVTQVWIGELPPEFGSAGKRLVVFMNTGRYEDILVATPMDVNTLANYLRNLADRLIDPLACPGDAGEVKCPECGHLIPAWAGECDQCHCMIT